MSKPATPRAPPSFAALVQSFFTEHFHFRPPAIGCSVATCGRWRLEQIAPRKGHHDER